MNKLGFSSLRTSNQQRSLPQTQKTFQTSSRSSSDSITMGSFANLKLTAKKLVKEQASVKTDLEITKSMERKSQNVVNENAKLIVQQQEDAKIWNGLEPKFSLTKALCDQPTETMQLLATQVLDAEQDKKLIEAELSIGLDAFDNLQLQYSGLTVKLESAEENLRKGYRQLLELKTEKDVKDKAYVDECNRITKLIGEKDCMIKDVEGSLSAEKLNLAHLKEDVKLTSSSSLIKFRKRKIDELGCIESDDVRPWKKGTTGSGFFHEERIAVTVDARSSNENFKDGKKKSGWKLEVENANEKAYEITPKILGVMSGFQRPLRLIVLDVCEWAMQYPDATVEQVADHICVFMKELISTKDYSFGTIIAGHDTTGFQARKIIAHEQKVTIERFTAYDAIGTGSRYALDSIRPCFGKEMPPLSREEAVDLGYEAIFNASLFDKATDGNVSVYEVLADGIYPAKRLSTLEVYTKYFVGYGHEQERVVFLAYKDNCGICSSNDLITCLKDFGTITHAHVVDHRKGTTNVGGATVMFYFHRLLFKNSEEADKFLSKATERRTDVKRDVVTKEFTHIIRALNKKFLLCKASLKALQHIIQYSTQKVDLHLAILKKDLKYPDIVKLAAKA